MSYRMPESERRAGAAHYAAIEEAIDDWEAARDAIRREVFGPIHAPSTPEELREALQPIDEKAPNVPRFFQAPSTPEEWAEELRRWEELDRRLYEALTARGLDRYRPKAAENRQHWLEATAVSLEWATPQRFAEWLGAHLYGLRYQAEQDCKRQARSWPPGGPTLLTPWYDRMALQALYQEARELAAPCLEWAPSLAGLLPPLRERQEVYCRCGDAGTGLENDLLERLTELQDALASVKAGVVALETAPGRTSEAEPPGDELHPVALNFEAIADALLLENQAGPAKLVRFMADKESADWRDVAEACCREDSSETAVKSLRQRTNNALAALNGPIAPSARRLRFSFAGYRVLRKIGQP